MTLLVEEKKLVRFIVPNFFTDEVKLSGIHSGPELPHRADGAPVVASQTPVPHPKIMKSAKQQIK